MTAGGRRRAMNSLQFISGLLTLQSKAAVNADTAARLDMAGSRVGTVARVHRHFYLDHAVETTRALEYTKPLTADLATVIEPARLRVEGRSTPIPIAQHSGALEFGPNGRTGARFAIRIG